MLFKKISNCDKIIKDDGDKMKKILITEDDLKITEGLTELLKNNNYEVSSITDFKQDVTEEIINSDFDLLLLDINLPNQNGFEICRKIKEVITKPIIFVTSNTTEEAELKSILLGGTDFITKPYNKMILLEKIKRALNQNDPINFKELKVGDVVLDLHLSLIKYKDKEVELSRNEFRILYYLFLNVGKVLKKEELLDYLWNDKYYLDENILTVNMNRLRKKLEEIDLKDFVKTIRGEGYQIC